MKCPTSRLFILSFICLGVLIAGCGGKRAVLEDADDYITTIDGITLPNDVKVIGLGEATHGNIEYQELKKAVFEVLIKNENVRVFVLEGDFGGGQQINDFILHGEGTAKEAVYALDYGIYKTEQMIDLVEWLKEYNETVDESEKVYFYGNDMQRFDYNKQSLLAYFDVVNKEASENYATELEHITNDTMQELTTVQLEELIEIMDDITSDLEANEDDYIAQSSGDSYMLALQYANLLQQRTDLLMNEEQYANLRDRYLAENLEWIVDFEATHGHDKVFISAHNGHIEKTSAAFGYKSMGDYLDEVYGNHYFAIGTDFINNTFQAYNEGAGKRENYTLKNSTDLVNAFREVDPNIFYVDFDRVEESEELLDIISTEQKMPNIGDDFRAWYKFLKMFYTIKMVPNEAYDGIIVVKDASPTTVME